MIPNVFKVIVETQLLTIVIQLKCLRDLFWSLNIVAIL